MSRQAKDHPIVFSLVNHIGKAGALTMGSAVHVVAGCFPAALLGLLKQVGRLESANGYCCAASAQIALARRLGGVDEAPSAVNVTTAGEAGALDDVVARRVDCLNQNHTPKVSRKLLQARLA